MIATVALLMEIESVALFEGLARSMPVWIADTASMAPYKDLLRDEREDTSITWFPLRSNELLTEAAVRIAYSLDDHFNALAQRIGYRTLLVFGAEYNASVLNEIAALGFSQVDRTNFGFVAAKLASSPR